MAALGMALAACGGERKNPTEDFDLEPRVDGSVPDGGGNGGRSGVAGASGAGRGAAGSGTAGRRPPPMPCGNGIVEGGEQCDGTTGLSCGVFGFGRGTVGCDDECRFDVSTCSDAPDCAPDARTTLAPACRAALCACDPGLFSQCGQTCLRALECAIATCGPSGSDFECVFRNCGTDGIAMEALALYSCAIGNQLCVPPNRARCGDGFIDPATEECDPAVMSAGFSCRDFGYVAGELSCDPVNCYYRFDNCVSNLCGNGVIEGMEQCDRRDLHGASCAGLGLGQGELACTSRCTFDTSGCSLCGNQRVESGEECDGRALRGQSCQSLGFTSGELACTASCEFDASGCGRCGDGKIDAGENCEGADLRGATCQSLGLGDGTLGCSASSCHYDTRGCSTAGSCGDGVVQTDEQCDGDDLTGHDCRSLGFRTGTLACNQTTCRFATSRCGDSPDLQCTDRCVEDTCSAALEACANTPLCEDVRKCLDNCRESPTLMCVFGCSSNTSAIAAATIASDCVADCAEACL